VVKAFTTLWGTGTVYLASEVPLHKYLVGTAWTALGGIVIVWMRAMYFASQWKELEEEEERRILGTPVGPSDSEMKFLNRPR
jgi:hypothetical protein